MKTLIQLLLDFESLANQPTFRMIFGDYIGDHLWMKFSVNYKHNFLNFYRSLDTENETLILKYLELCAE